MVKTKKAARGQKQAAVFQNYHRWHKDMLREKKLDFKVLNSARTIQVVRHVCREHGFTGSVYEDNHDPGSHAQELAILGLLGRIPVESKRQNLPFVRQLIRNAVLNSGDGDE